MCGTFSHPIEEKVIAEYKADDGKKHGQKMKRTSALANTMDMLIPMFLKKKYTEFLEAFDDIVYKTHEIVRLGRKEPRLATALINYPGFLIVYEPFVNLDIGMQELLKSILTQFQGKNTLLITSNNLYLVADICDTFLIIDKGKIIFDFRKSDYSNINELKEEIKQRLIFDERKVELQWLQ